MALMQRHFRSGLGKRWWEWRALADRRDGREPSYVPPEEDPDDPPVGEPEPPVDTPEDPDTENPEPGVDPDFAEPTRIVLEDSKQTVVRTEAEPNTWGNAYVATPAEGYDYWEVHIDASTPINATLAVGITNLDMPLNGVPGDLAGTAAYWSTGKVRVNSVDTTGFATYARRDKIMIARDNDTGRIWFGKDGVWLGSTPAVAGSGHQATLTGDGPYYPFVALYSSGAKITFKFIVSKFSYTMPTGFFPLGQTPAAGETGADIDAAVIPFSMITGLGTQSATDTSFGGGTPKVAMIQAGRVSTAKGTGVVNATMCYGAADGTSQFASFSMAQNSSGEVLVGVTDQVIISSNTTAFVDAESSFSAFLANGVTINTASNGWDTAFKNTAIVIGGADITAKVGIVTPVTGGGTAVNLGWQPDAIIFYYADGAFSDTIFNGGRNVMGFAAWDSLGVLGQATAGYRSDTGTTRLYRTFVATDAAIAGISATASSFTFKANVTRSGTGFTITSDAASSVVGYIALKLDNGGKAQAGTWALPAGTGAASKTGIGFKPKLVLLAGTDRTATGVASGTQFTIGAMSRIKASNHLVRFVSDGVVTAAVTGHMMDDDGLFGRLGDTGNSADFDIDLTSMDADGWTVNVVDAPAGAYLWPYLAIG